MSEEIYNSCDWVTSGIHFWGDSIQFCCYQYLHSKYNGVLIPNYKGELIDYEQFFKIRQKFIELAKAGNHHPSCKNCIYLSDSNWSTENYFDHFIFNHWTNCNSKCIYCYSTNTERKQYYNVYPVIEDMRKRGYLKATPRACVVFGGGEPTILKEFEKLMHLFFEENFKNIRVNSSGIKFSNMVAKGLKDDTVSLVISPDCGSKDMYLKIKQVNCFDKVWSNIKKYASFSNSTQNLKIKYIIIPGLNDDREEIDKWFNMIHNSGVKAVSVSVEQSWYFKYNPNFPQHIYNTINYIQDKAEKLSLDMEIYCEAISVLREGEKNNIKTD